MILHVLSAQFGISGRALMLFFVISYFEKGFVPN